MKKSIRKKINILIILSIVIMAVVMALTHLLIVSRYTAKDSGAMMQNTCSAKAKELDNQFELVEQSVQNIYDISEAIRPSVNELRYFDITEEYIKEVQKIAVTIADNTEGAITVYYRINPDLNVNGKQGFFYVKSQETGNFEYYEITDILAYDVNDIEHVGWYYIPVWAGEPVWMEPYYNANINVEMISYVVPIFDGNSLIGVVGMDVDFERLIRIAEDFNIYKSSGAVFASLSNSEIYYKDCDSLVKILQGDLYNTLRGFEESEAMLSYKIDGMMYRLCYKTLRNHMRLIAYAKRSDVNEQSTISLLASGIILLVISGVTLIIAMHTTKKITVPISTVTNAAKEYASGNWDVTVSCDTNDELRELTDSITVMAKNTKRYIDYIKDMAKKDGLTGLKNKTSYLMYVDEINEKYQKENRNYAVIVFDLNHLKHVNDNYGHEKGDELIVDGSKFICSRFKQSPVFRIGGDEFVAILDSADYPDREELFTDFQKYMKLAIRSKDEFEVCIASGMAVFGEDGETYDEVFNAADQRMYQNKKELKAQR